MGIQEGDLIMVDTQVDSIHFSSQAVQIVESMAQQYKTFASFIDYMKEFQVENGLKYETNEVYTPSNLLSFAKEGDDPNVGNAYLNSEQTKKAANTNGILNVNIFNPIISRGFKQAIITFNARRN